MTFDQLTPKEQKEVIRDVKKCFSEFQDNKVSTKNALMDYLYSKDDFRRVNIAEEDKDPIWVIEW